MYTAKPKPKEQFKLVSLQAKTRRQEIEKISQENLDFSKRLIEKKPYLDRKKWGNDYNMSKYYMGNICEYPSVDFDKKMHYDNNNNNSITASNNFINTTSKATNMRSNSTGFKEISSQLNLGFTSYNKTNKDKFVIFNKLIDGIIAFKM